jgi:hypothetical protein
MGYYTLNCGLIGKGRTTNTGVLNLDRSKMTAGYVHYGLQLHLFAGDSNSYPGSGTTWYDLSGNGRHGEIEGNPTYTATPGYFDMTSDNTYVDIPNDGLSPGSDDYTYSMWINFDSFDSGDEIFSNGRYNSASGGISLRISTSDRLQLYHDNYFVGYISTGGVTDGEWVNFVIVRENGVGKFYYKGVLEVTLTGDNMSRYINISPSYSDLRLMRSVRYSNDNVDGKIAQFSVYDRALSLEEVTKNHGYFGSRLVGPPVLTSSSPANGSTNHPGNFAIGLGFSSELAIGTGNVVIKKSSDNSIFETISVTSNQVTILDGGLTIIIEPSSTLVDGTQYYINIDATAFYHNKGFGYYAGISDTTTLSFTAAAVIGLVANGLELHLDASDSNSYSGSGTTWSDLSGNGNDATLVNGPTFNSGFGGYFDLDGSDDYVSETSGLSDSFLQGDWTISFWVNFDVITTSSAGRILLQHGTNSSRRGLHLEQRNSSLIFGLYNDDLDGSQTLSAGTWYNITFTLNSTTRLQQIFIDGSLDNSRTANGAYVGTGSNTRIGGRVLSFSNYLDGKMSSISTYSRVLSSLEVYHNFTLDRDRHFTPVLTSSSPANGLTNYPGNFAITLSFNHPITIGTGNVVIKKSSDNSIFETISVTSNQVTGNGTSSISVQPSSTLVDGTQYYINIDATAFSNNGVYYAGISDTTTLSFTAAAAATGPVTTDLALHLDAYNNSSYSGSGNTWTDLSGNGNNATRTNSSEVVYNSNGWFDWTDGPASDSTQGCFTLPNDSFTLGANFTIEVWNYYDSTSAPTTTPWAGGNLWTNSANSDWNGGAGNNNGLLFGYNSMRYKNTSNSETQLMYSSNPTTQVWHQHVLVVDSGTATVYVDKNSVGTASDIRTYTQSNGTLGIGIADKFGSNSHRGEYLGFISIVRIYQKSLSALEILQNYNVHKGRYGL